MKKRTLLGWYIPIYFTVLILAIVCACTANRHISVGGENIKSKRTVVVIDAGHGGVDGGATSCTGVLESAINLEIALRLDALVHLLGYDTIMTRTTDTSIHTNGNTIAQKKVSDLKERVRIINSLDDAVLISIHQNIFPESRYRGAQVFYAKTEGSEIFAKQLQNSLIDTINPGSRRLAKKSSGVYLMEHIHCDGVLVECGFISNPEEEQLLLNETYQKKLCCVIAANLCDNLDRKHIN